MSENRRGLFLTHTVYAWTVDPTLDLGGGCGSGKATRLKFFMLHL